MFCPVCKAEYRRGFTRCADCDVDLIETLPSEKARSEKSRAQLRTIWVGDDDAACVSLCLGLKNAGIRYEVSQDTKSRRSGMTVIWRYELLVPVGDEERAKSLLDLPDTVVEEYSDITEEDEDQALFELPAVDDAPSDETKGDSYLDPWDPQDATVEIWSQPAHDESTMVSMALRENRIRVRVEGHEDGSKKYLVLPEDENAAREIVREIQEDSPRA